MNIIHPSEPKLKICVLGGCKFQCEGSIVRLETAKTSALLAYLALQSRPQPRHKLIGLFWGDQPEARARRNLRHALWNIRQQFHCPDQLPVLLSDSQEVAFNPAAGGWLDVREFEQCLKKEREITAAAICTDDRFALLRQAADLYCGDLLDGVNVNDAPEFEQWVLVERERLRAQMLETLQRLVGYFVDWGEYAPGLDYVRRLLEMEPWLEEAHRQKMRLLALGGQHSAALAQYETCRRVLAEELNVEPSRETQSLYESIRTLIEKEPSDRPVPRRKLPPQTTPFVGREEELAQIATLLDDSACRLVTLVGPGGIGKTRLAVSAAAECERFRDGICFVPLAGVTSSDLLILAVADALGLTLHSSESMQAQLMEWLREKELLLLLDNFEHLLAAAELNTEILCSAPGVKILVTSRERLNLREEWLFPVEGLRYPLPEEEISSSIPLDAYAAIQLFVQGAQRAHFGFELTEADQPYVVRLCRLVAGTPLAIELAANWVRHLSCQEIVARIQKSMDFLTTNLRDLPVRHRSMRAVFEQSWQLLSKEEREVFKRLSVFRGGFRQEAAEPVAGANLDRLASLVDKSFLKRTPSGRYEVHELLRQYGAEKLSAAEAAQARETHGVYFAQFLGARDSDLLGHRVKEALEEIADDLENIRASWQGFIERRSLLEMGQAGHALYRFYDLRSWFQEGGAVFEQATAALNTLAPEPKQQLVLARLYNFQGIFCNRVQHFPKAIKALEASIAIARQIDHKKTLFAALVNLAGSHIMHGEFVVSRQLLEEAMVGFRQLDDKPDLFVAQDNLGFLLYKIGDYAQARTLLEQTMESLQSFGKGYDQAFIYYHLGLIAQAEKESGQAVWSYQQGLSISRETGHTWGATLCTSGLASVALQNGEYDQAVLLAQEGLSQAKKVDNVYVAVMCLNCLGQAAGAKGNVVEAQNYHRQAIRIAWETGQFSLVLDNLIGLAELELKGEQIQSAGELLAFAIHHPSTCALDRDRAERLFVQLEPQLTLEAIVAAQKQSLEAVVERIFTS